jgi:DNA-binding CsgD family transcriptional regulator
VVAATWTREANTWSAGFQRAEPRAAAPVASQHTGGDARPTANGSDVEGQDRANGHAADPIVPLTRREGEIANLAAQGLSSRSISERLFLSARTVENHLARVYTKLGIGSRAELAHALASA